MKFEIQSPGEIALTLAERTKSLRLHKKWKRSTLAERSGVTVSSLRRFEQTGKISLLSLLKLMSALGRLDEMDALLQPPAARSIEDLAKQDRKLPQRGSV